MAVRLIRISHSPGQAKLRDKSGVDPRLALPDGTSDHASFDALANRTIMTMPAPSLTAQALRSAGLPVFETHSSAATQRRWCAPSSGRKTRLAEADQHYSHPDRLTGPMMRSLVAVKTRLWQVALIRPPRSRRTVTTIADPAERAHAIGTEPVADYRQETVNDGQWAMELMLTDDAPQPRRSGNESAATSSTECSIGMKSRQFTPPSAST